MGTLIRLVVITVSVVVALAATLVIIVLFPPSLIALFLGLSVAFGWWGLGGLRRRQHRFLSVVAVCASPVFLVVALGAAFAFAPVNSQPSEVHTTPVTSPSP